MRAFQGLIIVFILQGCAANFTVSQISTQQYVFENQSVDASIDGIVKPYRDSLDVRVNRVLVVSDAELLTGGGKNIKPAQTAMGNFIVDACLDVARQRASFLSKPQPDIAILTWGSIRSSLPAGGLSVRHIYQVMPFENELIVLTVTGSQLQTLLNYLAINTNPLAGATLIKGENNQILVNGSPVEETKLYRVLASDYLAFGGDNMPVLKDATERYFCDMKMRDALIVYLENLKANGKNLVPNYEQRITN
jgi:2',3'-cyclic-nucleotide 2'-phosphodiesterase (5'-nucleotidase family)